MILWFRIEVRFLHGRYHGRDGWPLSPLPLFQAITAGALSGRWVVENRTATEKALRWLESLGTPDLVLAPANRDLRPYGYRGRAGPAETGTRSSVVRLARLIEVSGDPDVAGREISMLDRYAGAARV